MNFFLRKHYPAASFEFFDDDTEYKKILKIWNRQKNLNKVPQKLKKKLVKNE